MADDDTIRAAVAAAEAEVVALSRAQDEARARLAALRESASTPSAPRQVVLPIVADALPPPFATATDKIRLFRSLFRGRTDIFPKRWENTKQARSGYSPACANEWVQGVCGKPRVKCGERPCQAFVRVDDRVIADHLGGRITAGVYPLLPDDTCWFVAADFDEERWQDDISAFGYA